jgi:hypothetical protein
MRIERRGKVDPLTPRFIKFLVEELGGELLDDIQAPSDRRIDYRCLRGLLAIELKTLEEDATERMSNLTDELEKRDDWPQFYGSWPIESVLSNLDDPEPVRQKTGERIGRAIVNHLKKANKQLAAHVQDFPRNRVIRLVVLLNEDHEIYDPATVTYLMQKELGRRDGDQPRYECIDAVMFLTERHATRVGNDVAFFVGAFTGQPMEDSPWKGDVLDEIGKRWSRWNGARAVPRDAEAVNSFSTIDHVPDEMRRHDLWRLQYRRKPYMQALSNEQVRDRWDECTVRSMFAFMKDSPAKPAKDESMRNMEIFTHVSEEIARRGIPLPQLQAEMDRLLAAGIRLKLSPEQQDWLAANIRHLKDRPPVA